MIKPSLDFGIRRKPPVVKPEGLSWEISVFYEGANDIGECELPPLNNGHARTRVSARRVDIPQGLEVIIVDEESKPDAFKERGGCWELPNGATIKPAPLIGGREANRLLKEALGIDPKALLQRIVIEVDCERIPTVYVKGPGTRRLIQAAAGLFSVVPVADVTVDEKGNVETKPL